MSVLDEIKASVAAACEALDSAKNAVDTALNEAQDKVQEVAELGLEGVASTLQSVSDSLEAAASSLNGAHDAAGAADGTVREITDKTGASQAVDHLGSATGQIDEVANGVATADGIVQDAYNHAQQAEVDSVIATVSAASDSLESARQTLIDARTKTDTYLQQIQAASQGN